MLVECRLKRCLFLKDRKRILYHALCTLFRYFNMRGQHRPGHFTWKTDSIQLTLTRSTDNVRLILFSFLGEDSFEAVSFLVLLLGVPCILPELWADVVLHQLELELPLAGGAGHADGVRLHLGVVECIAA